MTDNNIHARLGYLEQALQQLADTGLKPSARTVAEKYVARYYDDFGVHSLQIFAEYVKPGRR